MSEILHHPFLTEEVHDQLGYDNWYSDDTATATQDVMERDEEKQLECMVKSELLKHKVSLLRKALLQRKQSQQPCMLSLIDADESASIGLFVPEQFSEPFAFQLRMHSESAKSRLKAHQNAKRQKKRRDVLKKLYEILEALARACRAGEGNTSVLHNQSYSFVCSGAVAGAVVVQDEL